MYACLILLLLAVKCENIFYKNTRKYKVFFFTSRNPNKIIVFNNTLRLFKHFMLEFIILMLCSNIFMYFSIKETIKVMSIN